MKNRVFRILGLLLVIIGISAILYGTYNKVKTDKAQKSLINDFDNVLKKIENGDIKEPKSAEASETRVNAIAILEIPKIGLKVAVAEGTSDDIISYAVGHFTGTALPGEIGNCALVGHRNFTTGEFFLRINKLEPGDDIKITTFDKTYTYKVKGQQTVNPQDVYVLNPTKTPTITLVTCSLSGKQRLIVKGELAQ